MAQVDKKKRHYSKVGLQVRKKIINRVVQQGYSIASSAKYLKIKLSSAKVIIKKYRKTGQIHVGRVDRLNNERQLTNLKLGNEVPQQKPQEATVNETIPNAQNQNLSVTMEPHWFYPYPQWGMNYPQQFYHPYWYSYYPTI